MASNPNLKAAILIISDTASADNSTDKAGSVLRDVFSASSGVQWDIVDVKIVPDDVLEIQTAIQGWSDSGDTINCIVTSGGTGFAIKDRTPEVSHRSIKFKLKNSKRKLTEA